MTSEPKNDQKPDWLNNLNVTCVNCQQPSDHLAFIEKFDGKNVIIYDYHHCKNCRMFHETKCNKNNYDLFFNNSLSKRSIDPNTGKKIISPPVRDAQYGQ